MPHSRPAPPSTVAFALLFAIFLAPLLALGACSSIRTTDPARTATEQFLLSKAARDAVDGLSFENLAGRKVFVDSTFFAASDQAFVLGELRAKLLLASVRLVQERNDAEVILEVRSAGVGIDRYDSLVGIAPLPLISGVTGATPLTTPEVAITKNQDQRGVASVAYVAFWKETGDVVSSSGPTLGRSLRDDWWFFGFGPRTVGDIPPATNK